MRMETLTPVFICSGVVNLVLITTIVMLSIKNVKLGQKEFYRSFIMLFVTFAYITRIAAYFFFVLVIPNEVYNRPYIWCNYDYRKVFLVYAPVVFHSLGGLAYWWRWVHYYLLATAATLEDQERTEKLSFANKISFFGLIIVSLASIVLMCYSKEAQYGWTIFEVAFYILVAVGLQVVIALFLYKLKLSFYHIYKQKK